MNQAIQKTSNDLNICIAEFTVAGVPYESFFAHHWYVACEDEVEKNVLKNCLDEHLKKLNDDYAVERKSALKDIFVTILPEKCFLEFMEIKGKVGGQHKFPRVLKGQMLEDWKLFISKNYSSC